MEILKSHDNCPDSAKRTVIALGNFDGVHRGHQKVIAETINIAEKTGCPSAIMTFEPHPITILRPEIPPVRITPFSLKAELIASLGIDIMFAINFDKKFSEISAMDFIEKILIADPDISHVVVGHDFIFGHERSGNAGLIKEMSQKHGFGFTQVEPQKEGEEIFSSTKIRNALKEGNLQKALSMLGHSYEINGIVKEGDKRGRTLGFPTANIHLEEQFSPAYGVYRVEIKIANEGSWLPGIANFGKKPTFAGKNPVLEIHIFDFNDDLYGKQVRVRMLEFIRQEKEFGNVKNLVAQINKDCEQARKAFLV